MRKSRQHTVVSNKVRVAREKKRASRARIILLLLFYLTTLCSSLTPALAEINNTLAYSISHTSSTVANDLREIGTATIAQTVLATTDETWYGIVVYLDRQGLFSSTYSVRLRFRLNLGIDECTTPDTGGAVSIKRDVYVKVIDIPDGDPTRNTLPPDSVARGYAI